MVSCRERVLNNWRPDCHAVPQHKTQRDLRGLVVDSRSTKDMWMRKHTIALVLFFLLFCSLLHFESQGTISSLLR